MGGKNLGNFTSTDLQTITSGSRRKLVQHPECYRKCIIFLDVRFLERIFKFIFFCVRETHAWTYFLDHNSWWSFTLSRGYFRFQGAERLRDEATYRHERI